MMPGEPVHDRQECAADEQSEERRQDQQTRRRRDQEATKSTMRTPTIAQLQRPTSLAQGVTAKALVWPSGPASSAGGSSVPGASPMS
jgi:hypothetical protein